MASYSSFISAEEEERVLRLVSNPSPAYPDRPSFPFETIHISCKSDAYQGNDYRYAGVIIYSCDGKSKWQTANGTRCKSGYLVIMDTSTKKVKKYQEKKPRARTWCSLQKRLWRRMHRKGSQRRRFLCDERRIQDKFGSVQSGTRWLPRQ